MFANYSWLVGSKSCDTTGTRAGTPQTEAANCSISCAPGTASAQTPIQHQVFNISEPRVEDTPELRQRMERLGCQTLPLGTGSMSTGPQQQQHLSTEAAETAEENRQRIVLATRRKKTFAEAGVSKSLDQGRVGLQVRLSLLRILHLHSTVVIF